MTEKKIITREGKIETTLLLLVSLPILVFLMSFCILFWFFYHPYRLADQIALAIFFFMCLICTISLLYYYHRLMKVKSHNAPINWKIVGISITSIFLLFIGLLLIGGAFVVGAFCETDCSVGVSSCCISGLIITLIALYLMIYLNKHHLVK